MFGFGKKKHVHEKDAEENNAKKKRKNRVDKLVMGAILGVAIGSVVGISLAPKKDENGKKKVNSKNKEIEEIAKQAEYKKIPREVE